MSNLFSNFFPPQLENGETPVYSSGMFNERETAETFAEIRKS